MKANQQQQPAIVLEPPWWRCENGSEFQSGHNKPKRCPVCGSTDIEMVVDIDLDPLTYQRRRNERPTF